MLCLDGLDGGFTGCHLPDLSPKRSPLIELTTTSVLEECRSLLYSQLALRRPDVTLSKYSKIFLQEHSLVTYTDDKKGQNIVFQQAPTEIISTFNTLWGSYKEDLA